MAQLRYLTLQDMIWISFQVTRETLPYDFARLEEATFYQYSYGQVVGLLPQAHRFVTGLIAKAPFAHSNDATALVALCAFMGLNGYRAKLDAPALSDWLDRVQGSEFSPEAMGEAFTADSHGHHGDESVQALVKRTVARLRAVLDVRVEASRSLHAGTGV